MKQYQTEERSLMAICMKHEKLNLHPLLDCMEKDKQHLDANLMQLQKELSQHYKNKAFLTFQNVGDVVELSLKMVTEF